MSSAIRFIVRVGAAADAVAATLRAVPAAVGDALAMRRYRRIAVTVAAAYLIVYLIAIQDVAFSGSGQFGRVASVPSIDVVPDWTDKLLATRAPLLFEPIATVYLLAQLAVFVSPGNLFAGSLLGVLLGLNVTVASYRAAQLRACRRRRWAGLLAGLPPFLMGFGCCAPTLLLLLGSNFATAVLPAFLPFRPFLFPLAITLMAALLAWTSHPVRATHLESPTTSRRSPWRRLSRTANAPTGGSS